MGPTRGIDGGRDLDNIWAPRFNHPEKKPYCGPDNRVATSARKVLQVPPTYLILSDPLLYAPISPQPYGDSHSEPGSESAAESYPYSHSDPYSHPDADSDPESDTGSDSEPNSFLIRIRARVRVTI